MNYDDFPILKNDDYKLINEAYNETNIFERQTHLLDIVKLCNYSQLDCIYLSAIHNSTINKALDLTHSALIKLSDNISSLFNISLNTTNNSANGVFQLLENLTTLAEHLHTWQENELKAYYKSFASNSYHEISSMIKHILKSIQESRIISFKHM